MVVYHIDIRMHNTLGGAMRADTVREVGRPKKEEPTSQLRLPQSTVRRLRRLASHLGKEPGDYAAEKLGPVLDREEAKMLADIAKEREDEK
jgi:predicted DNA-binding protein